VSGFATRAWLPGGVHNTGTPDHIAVSRGSYKLSPYFVGNAMRILDISKTSDFEVTVTVDTERQVQTPNIKGLAYLQVSRCMSRDGIPVWKLRAYWDGGCAPRTRIHHSTYTVRAFSFGGLLASLGATSIPAAAVSLADGLRSTGTALDTTEQIAACSAPYGLPNPQARLLGYATEASLAVAVGM
jgi:hypothetical protein